MTSAGYHKPVGVGVIGLGFMGATHIRAYAAANNSGHPCRLIAVSDQDPARLAGRAASAGNLDSGSGRGGELLFDPALVRTHTDPKSVYTDPDIQLVSICTPTDSHVDLAIAALRAGKHALVEKPVAVASAEVHRLAAVVKETGRLCMPGMCMRFWPGWDWLCSAVRSNRYGRVLSATFQRLGTMPTWSADFYGNLSRSGGALTDLHIHDADFIRWCFGPPREVVSTGTHSHVTTIYRYGSGGPTHIVAEGGQDHHPGFGFKMRYIVAFEHATADWDLMRTPALILSRNGNAETVPLEPGAGYDPQIRHMLDAVTHNRANADLRATIDEAAAVAELLEAERKSLETGSAVAV